MAGPSRTVVGLAVGVIALLAVAVFKGLFGTVLLAITVAYVLTPVQRWFLGRGWRRRRASVATAGLATVAVGAVVAPLAYVAFQRRTDVVAVVEQLPAVVRFDIAGTEVALSRDAVVDVVLAYLPPLVIDTAVFLSSASIKFALFAVVVFGLLLGHEQARRAILAPVPRAYLPFVEALEERARETLVAILVLQVGTAIGTVLLAAPMFYILGYDYSLVLAVFSGVLQFLPVIGPIVLLLALGALHVLANELLAAVIVIVVGGIIIGWLPDLLVRPYLARYTAGISGSLYFIGFIGGLTSLGLVGIIAGPLVVALLVEGVEQLAALTPDSEGQP